MGPAVALGLARFAYALLLPAMRLDLSWTYADAGAMNTANAAGYLAGAMIAAPVARRFGVKQTFLAGIVATALGYRRIGPDFTVLGSDELAGVGGPVGRVGVCGGRLDDSGRQRLGRAGAACARNLLCGRRTGRGHVCRRRAVVARHGGVAGRLAGARRAGPGRKLDRVAGAAARAVARGTICDGEGVDVVAAAR